MWGCFKNHFVNDTRLDPRPLPSLHMRRRYSVLSWNTKNQVFEGDDNDHSISYAIFRQEKRGLHKCIARFPAKKYNRHLLPTSWHLIPFPTPPPKECTGWRTTLTSQSKFPEWMVYQIFLAMGFRSRARERQELRITFPVQALIAHIGKEW